MASDWRSDMSFLMNPRQVNSPVRIPSAISVETNLDGNTRIASSKRQRDFCKKQNPLKIAGFSVKFLVALPGIEPGF